MTQTATVERPHRPGTFTSETARAATAERERQRLERIGGARQALEAGALEIAERFVAVAIGKAKMNQQEYLAGKFALEQVLGQATARTEHVNLDRWDAEWREFLERQSA